MDRVLRFLPFMLLLLSANLYAQHLNKMDVEVDYEQKIVRVKQEITFHNTTDTPLTSITLNDWNNSYSDKNTPLGRRFSDEYIRAFHLAKDHERGNTSIHSITSGNQSALKWMRPDGHPDLIDIQLDTPLYPNQKFTIHLAYDVKIPSDRFTRYGYEGNGNLILKNWYLTPARIENGYFVKYSNENLDDIANAVCDYQVTLLAPENIKVSTDLYVGNTSEKGAYKEYFLIGNGLTEFNMAIEKNFTSYEVYRNAITEVHTNLKDNRVTDIQKAVMVDKIVHFTHDNLGTNPQGKIMVIQADYERNPVYGLNQLPSFLAPFPDSFIYEIKFLKTYLNTYLKNTLKLDPRKDNWLYDGIQVYLMRKYVEENHPEKTMLGIKWGILKGHNLFTTPYNTQYSYLYLLMARKNLDQPIGDSKETFIKFNEQIAGKYKAGLGFIYLDDYLGNDIIPNTITEFYRLNLNKQTNRSDFKEILDRQSGTDNQWFFNTIVDSRDIIDYKFGAVKAEGDSLRVTLINKTGANAPVSLYGLNKNGIAFKKWYANIKTDTTFIIARQDAERLALNYNNEVPEYNRRNNWRKLDKFFPNDRPVKFNFFQDLENPAYNQIFFVPTFAFNFYDGISPGMRFHNKSLLEKPFIFDITPTYSPRTGELIGSTSFLVNQYIRDEGPLYNIRYSMSASTYHYAEDASYIKFTPSVQFRFRDDNLRKNKKQFFLVRNVLVDREKSEFVETTDQNENYSVFNMRYSSFESEITKHYNFFTDVQVSSSFGKLSGEFQFRRLFYNNRQINLRFYAGMFMYRSTNSEFFSFGLDRPTDYMFDYNFYGRSETTGIYSQQYVMAEGGFKSKLDTRYANQWMTTVNASFNVWNWIELYGDAGVFKNELDNAQFVYDSGVRLNLVPDYFELYFPVYSSNGFEMNEGNYSQKIRFVVTLSPGTLINLFTRKWF